MFSYSRTTAPPTHLSSSVVEMDIPFMSVLDLYTGTSYKIGSLKGTSYRSNFEVNKFFSFSNAEKKLIFRAKLS